MVSLLYIAEVDDLLVTIEPPREGIHTDLWLHGLSVRRDIDTNEIIGWEWIGNHEMHPNVLEGIEEQVFAKADVIVPDDHMFVRTLKAITEQAGV